MASFNFGTPNATGQTGFGLGGASAMKPAGGFSFGATQTPVATTAAAGGGFFNTPATSAQPLGGGFGTTNTSFGAQAVAAPGAGSAFSFAKPTGQPTGLNFSAAPQPTLGGATGPGQTTGFDFGKSTNLSLTTPSLGTAGGIGGGTGGLFATGFAPQTQQQQQQLQQQQPIQQQQPQSVGLGGIDINATKPKAVEGKNDNIKVKESQVPQEIIALVENLEAHIKKQKEISSEIAKPSTSKLFSVQSEIQRLNLVLADISNLVDNNYTGIKLLRAETNEAIENAEMAQRTIKTPACLQYENGAPLNYFLKLVQKYESDLIKLREQVEMTEKHMKSMTNFQKLSAEDLKKGLHQIHEIFISLAARIHDIHQKVEDQKLQYLNLRKLILQDKTNVFEEIENEKTKTNMSRVFAGPTPFSALSGINIGSSYNTTNKDSWLQNASSGQQPPNTFGARPAFGETNFLNSFGTGFNTNTNLAADSGFNLQKPPLGTKRNKH